MPAEHKISASSRQHGAYLYEEAGMRWLSLSELEGLAEEHGLPTFWDLLDKLAPLPFHGTLSGKGRRFTASRTA